MDSTDAFDLCQQKYEQFGTEQVILSPEKAQKIQELLDAIEKIDEAVESFNQLLLESGYPTKPIAVKHVGCKLLFGGAASVESDLQGLLNNSRAAELEMDLLVSSSPMVAKLNLERQKIRDILITQPQVKCA